MNQPYSPPVDQLLTMGMPEEIKFDWPGYLEMGFTEKDIPELIRMALDEELNWADSDSAELWAPVHAWRALGQLHAESAVEPLTTLFHTLEDSDWVGEELPIVMEMIGPAAIPYLDAYLKKQEYGEFPRVTAAHAIEKIGNRYPESKQRCKEVLIGHLKNFKKHPGTLNAFLISFLLDLNAPEAAPVMEQAFAAGQVDLSVAGDWEDVQIEMGLLAERKTPRKNYLLDVLTPEQDEPAREKVKLPPKEKSKKLSKEAKKKSKRKMAKKSRKQQHRRKK